MAKSTLIWGSGELMTAPDDAIFKDLLEQTTPKWLIRESSIPGVLSVNCKDKDAKIVSFKARHFAYDKTQQKWFPFENVPKQNLLSDDDLKHLNISLLSGAQLESLYVAIENHPDIKKFLYGEGDKRSVNRRDYIAPVGNFTKYASDKAIYIPPLSTVIWISEIHENAKAELKEYKAKGAPKWLIKESTTPNCLTIIYLACNDKSGIFFGIKIFYDETANDWSFIKKDDQIPDNIKPTLLTSEKLNALFSAVEANLKFKESLYGENFPYHNTRGDCINPKGIFEEQASINPLYTSMPKKKEQVYANDSPYDAITDHPDETDKAAAQKESKQEIANNNAVIVSAPHTFFKMQEPKSDPFKEIFDGLSKIRNLNAGRETNSEQYLYSYASRLDIAIRQFQSDQQLDKFLTQIQKLQQELTNQLVKDLPIAIKPLLDYTSKAIEIAAANSTLQVDEFDRVIKSLKRIREKPNKDPAYHTCLRNYTTQLEAEIKKFQEDKNFDDFSKTVNSLRKELLQLYNVNIDADEKIDYDSIPFEIGSLDTWTKDALMIAEAKVTETVPTLK